MKRFFLNRKWLAAFLLLLISVAAVLFFCQSPENKELKALMRRIEETQFGIAVYNPSWITALLRDNLKIPFVKGEGDPVVLCIPVDFRFTEQEMAMMSRTPQIKELYFYSSHPQLPHLQKMIWLEGLSFSSDNFGDSSIEILQKFPSLKSLGLYRVNISKDAARAIDGLSKLEDLTLWDCSISAELSQVKSEKKLKSVQIVDDFDDSGVNSRGLDWISTVLLLEKQSKSIIGVLENSPLMP